MKRSFLTAFGLIVTALNLLAINFGDIPSNTVEPSSVWGTGTVTNFSAGDLSPLFTTTETTTTTTPALSFSLSTAAANTVFGNNTGSTAAPGFQTLVDAQIPDILTLTRIINLTNNGFVKVSGSNGTLGVDTATYLTGNQTITLTGDATGSGTTSIAVVNAKVNGVTYPASPLTNTVPVVTAPTTVTYQAVPPAAGGVPTGGTANQVLAKIDATNYNTQWVAPGGGTNPFINADAPNNTIAANVLSGAPADIVNKSLTYAAGDQVVISISGAILNNSGAVATYSIKFNLGSLTSTFTMQSTIAASATNRAPVDITAKFSVKNTSSAWLKGNVTGSASGALGAVAQTISATLSGQTYNQSASNLTGAQTTSVQVYSSTNTATQSFELQNWSIYKLATNP